MSQQIQLFLSSFAFSSNVQAFLEMGTEEAAVTMVNYYSKVTPLIRNIQVFIQYSNHKELKTDAANQVSGN